MTVVGFAFHPDCLQHDPGPYHPEHPDRLTAIVRHLGASTIWPRLQPLTPTLAAPETIALVHPPIFIDTIEHACLEGPTSLDPDTVASLGSWQAARLAVGAVTLAIDAVMKGSVRSAFCAVRPPGHHALADRAMGFCLFNNVAIGAKYAQQQHRLSRILIVDWDVHHGNGTQAIFYDDPSVFYFSTHQYPLYPGTGSSDEIGEGKGRGTTLNVPLPAGSGDAEIIKAFEEKLLPAANTFKPELILISAGFDAHRNDPLAQLNVTEAGYAKLTELVVAISRAHCPGRIVSVLEGGYNLTALGRSIEAHLHVLGDGH